MNLETFVQTLAQVRQLEVEVVPTVESDAEDSEVGLLRLAFPIHVGQILELNLEIELPDS